MEEPQAREYIPARFVFSSSSVFSSSFLFFFVTVFLVFFLFFLLNELENSASVFWEQGVFRLKDVKLAPRPNRECCCRIGGVVVVFIFCEKTRFCPHAGCGGVCAV